jgi:hypothetical protein
MGLPVTAPTATPICPFAGIRLGVADGIRTRDRRHHKPELYQLSYCHLAAWNLAGWAGLGLDGNLPGEGWTNGAVVGRR